MLYKNKYGEIKTKDQCLDSYQSQDIAIRGIPAKVAFREDLKSGIFKLLTPKYCYLPEDGDCSFCPLGNKNRDCNNKRLKQEFLMIRKTI